MPRLSVILDKFGLCHKLYNYSLKFYKLNVINSVLLLS